MADPLDDKHGDKEDNEDHAKAVIFAPADFFIHDKSQTAGAHIAQNGGIADIALQAEERNGEIGGQYLREYRGDKGPDTGSAQSFHGLEGAHIHCFDDLEELFAHIGKGKHGNGTGTGHGAETEDIGSDKGADQCGQGAYQAEEQPDDGILHICMAGFRLGNTLSDNGSVTRGVCHIEEGALTGVTETHNIFKTADGAEARNDDKVEKLDVKSLVSMNMWGLTPVFMDTLEKGFVDFLSEIKEGDIKKEYLLPEMIDCLIKEGKAKVDVLETKDTWFGVTYQEDKAAVTEAFANLVKSGVYPSNLYK